MAIKVTTAWRSRKTGGGKMPGRYPIRGRGREILNSCCTAGRRPQTWRRSRTETGHTYILNPRRAGVAAWRASLSPSSGKRRPRDGSGSVHFSSHLPFNSRLTSSRVQVGRANARRRLGRCTRTVAVSAGTGRTGRNRTSGLEINCHAVPRPQQRKGELKSCET